MGPRALWKVAFGIAVLSTALTATGFGGVQPPAAPSNVRFLGGQLFWEDNAFDEDGFRIIVRGEGGVLLFETTAQPNVTQTAIPLDAQLSCPDRPFVAFEVVAFSRQSGDSAPGLANIVGDCVPPTSTTSPTPLPSAPGLPTTGYGGPGGRGAQAAVVSALLFAVGAAFVSGLCGSRSR